VVGVLASVVPARAQGNSPDPPPIQDNSFLLEEAYNQEEGVVQHINAFHWMRGGTWAATFTQEWPAPRQAHQLSYSVLYLRVSGEDGSSTDLGDVALNYRYQLAGSGQAKFALTPRVSLLFPTGNEERGLGAGALGVQLALAASTVLSSQLVAHTNFGVTYVGSARNERREKADTTAWNAGQSFIWTFSPTWNAMLEAIWLKSESVVGPGRTERLNEFFVSPGVRWAYNLPSGLQIVPGIAFPIGVGSTRHERGVFLYLSFEHPFRR
jgi:outer membrane putative beta-barrel porin/alpha-amylase